MTDIATAGPRNPSRFIVVTTAIAAALAGVVTGKVWAFTLTLVGCAGVLCLGYAVLRRALGWKPLNVDDLLHLIGVMHP